MARDRLRVYAVPASNSQSGRCRGRYWCGRRFSKRPPRCGGSEVSTLSWTVERAAVTWACEWSAFIVAREGAEVRRLGASQGTRSDRREPGAVLVARELHRSCRPKRTRVLPGSNPLGMWRHRDRMSPGCRPSWRHPDPAPCIRERSMSRENPRGAKRPSRRIVASWQTGAQPRSPPPRRVRQSPCSSRNGWQGRLGRGMLAMPTTVAVPAKGGQASLRPAPIAAHSGAVLGSGCPLRLVPAVLEVERRETARRRMAAPVAAGRPAHQPLHARPRRADLRDQLAELLALLRIRRPGRHRIGPPCAPGRGTCQDLPLHLQPAVLAPHLPSKACPGLRLAVLHALSLRPTETKRAACEPHNAKWHSKASGSSKSATFAGCSAA